MIEVEHRSEEDNNGEQYYNGSNHLIYYYYAVEIELPSYLVHYPRKAIPPEQCARGNGKKTYNKLHGFIGLDEGKLREDSHEKKDNEGVGKRYEKCCNTIVEKRALRLPALMHLLPRVRPETIDAEKKKNYGAGNLECKLILGVLKRFHNETHAQAHHQRIDEIAHRSTHTGDETIPSALVERALNAQYTHRSHWRRSNDANDESFENKAYNIYVNRYGQIHNECKIAKFI